MIQSPTWLKLGFIEPLQVERLELACMGDPDKGKQALCFLGMLLAANHSLGVPSLKTASAIESGRYLLRKID